MKSYFGSHVRPANLAEDRIGRRLVENQTGKRHAVIAGTGRDFNAGLAVFGVLRAADWECRLADPHAGLDQLLQISMSRDFEIPIRPRLPRPKLNKAGLP